jgi:hypothetical protein
MNGFCDPYASTIPIGNPMIQADTPPAPLPATPPKNYLMNKTICYIKIYTEPDRSKNARILQYKHRAFQERNMGLFRGKYWGFPHIEMGGSIEGRTDTF